MSSRAILLAELEEESRKNKELDVSAAEMRLSEPGHGEGYDPYDNPGTHKATHPDDTVQRRVLRRR